MVPETNESEEKRIVQSRCLLQCLAELPETFIGAIEEVGPDRRIAIGRMGNGVESLCVCDRVERTEQDV